MSVNALSPASRAYAGVSSNISATTIAKAPMGVVPRSSAPLLASADIFSSATTALLLSAGLPCPPSDEASHSDGNPPSIASASDASRALSSFTTTTQSIPLSLGSYCSIGSYSHSHSYGRTVSGAGGAAPCRHPPHHPQSQQPTAGSTPWPAAARRCPQTLPRLLHLQPATPPPWSRRPPGSFPDGCCGGDGGVTGGEDGPVLWPHVPVPALAPRGGTGCSAAAVVADPELEPWLQLLEEGSEGEDELEGSDGGAEVQAAAPSASLVSSASGDGSGPSGDGEPPPPPPASAPSAESWAADAAEETTATSTTTTTTTTAAAAAAVSAPDCGDGDAPRAAAAAAAAPPLRVSRRVSADMGAIGAFHDVIAGGPASEAAAAAASGTAAEGTVMGLAGGSLVDAGWLGGDGSPAAVLTGPETGGIRTAFAWPLMSPAGAALASAAADGVGTGSSDLYGRSDRRSTTQPGAVRGTEWARNSKARCSSAVAAAASSVGAGKPGGKRLVEPRRRKKVEATDTDPTAAAFGYYLGDADAGGWYDRAPGRPPRRACIRGYMHPEPSTASTAPGVSGSTSAALGIDAGGLAAAAIPHAGTAVSGLYYEYGIPGDARRVAVQRRDGELVRDADAWVLATETGYGTMYGARRYWHGGAAALYRDGDDDYDDDDLAAAAVPQCRGGARRVRQVGYDIIGGVCSDGGGCVGRQARPVANTGLSCRVAPGPVLALNVAAEAAAAVDVGPVDGDWDSLWSAEDQEAALPEPQPSGQPPLPPPPPRPPPQCHQAAAAAARARAPSLTASGSGGPLLDLPDGLEAAVAALAAASATRGSPLASAAAADCPIRRRGEDDSDPRFMSVGDSGIAVSGGGVRACLCGFLRGMVRCYS